MTTAAEWESELRVCQKKSSGMACLFAVVGLVCLTGAALFGGIAVLMISKAAMWQTWSDVGLFGALALLFAGLLPVAAVQAWRLRSFYRKDHEAVFDANTATLSLLKGGALRMNIPFAEIQSIQLLRGSDNHWDLAWLCVETVRFPRPLCISYITWQGPYEPRKVGEWRALGAKIAALCQVPLRCRDNCNALQTYWLS